MDKKILIANLFVCVLLFTPIVIAKNTNKNVFNEIIKNPEIKSLDNYEEIITLIEGTADGAQINKRGLIRDIEFYAGGGTWLEIDGWRKPFWESYHEINVIYIHAYRFIGITRRIAPGIGMVHGIAIGNIDWIV
jgi:hypothetical protein